MTLQLDEFGKISDKLIHENSEPGKFEETKQRAEALYEKCKTTSKLKTPQPVRELNRLSQL